MEINNPDFQKTAQAFSDSTAQAYWSSILDKELLEFSQLCLSQNNDLIRSKASSLKHILDHYIRDDINKSFKKQADENKLRLQTYSHCFNEKQKLDNLITDIVDRLNGKRKEIV